MTSTSRVRRAGSGRRRSVREEKLAQALRELLGVVRLADSAGVDDVRYRLAIAVAQAVLNEFDAREES